MTGEYNGDRRAALGWLAGGGVVAAAAAVTVTESAAPAFAETTDIDLKDVPKVVKDAAEDCVKDHFKLKVEWLSAVKIEEEEEATGKKKPQKKVAYELDGRRKGDLDVTLMVTAAGKVIEVEKEIKDVDNVPAPVIAAVKKKWPAFTKVKEAHHIRQGKDLMNPKEESHVVFDLQCVLGKKDRDLKVQVSASGELLESTTEMLEAKWPDVVTKALDDRNAKKKVDLKIVTVFVLREGDKIIGYHAECTKPKGGEVTLSVSTDGKHIEVIE